MKTIDSRPKTGDMKTRRRGPVAGLAVAAVAVVALALAGGAAAQQATALAGDFDNGPVSLPQGADVALLGRRGWTTIPVAKSLHTPIGFEVRNEPVGGSFANRAAEKGVSHLTGDFNRDSRTDIALVGGIGWRSVPVALSRNQGRFLVVDLEVTQFARVASDDTAARLTGDFDGDGTTDLAVLGGAGWGDVVHVALSNGDGTFRDNELPHTALASWASDPGAQEHVGDFDGDGRDDILVTCFQDRPGLLVLRAVGPEMGPFFPEGSFYPGLYDAVWAPTNAVFGLWACQPGVTQLIADFNRDGRSDIALTGASGWTTLPVAFSSSVYGGPFQITNNAVGSFAAQAAHPDVAKVLGDFDGDNDLDIALVGQSNSPYIPVAFSNSNGTFLVTSEFGDNIPYHASQPGVTTLVGDFNADWMTDLLLIGGVGWAGLPSALGMGNGLFSLGSEPAGRFPTWAEP